MREWLVCWLLGRVGGLSLSESARLLHFSMVASEDGTRIDGVGGRF